MQGRLQSGQGRAAKFAREEQRAAEEKLTELYLAAFSRAPRAEEVQFVMQKLGDYQNRQQGWEDVIWAILNTREFQFVK